MAARKKNKRASSKKNTRKSPKPGFFAWVFKWAFVAGLWAAIVVGAICAWYATELPDITRTATFERKSSITIKAADGAIIARYGETKGVSVETRDMPPHLIYAVLAIEDRRFYSHFGIDLLGLARAMGTNLIEGRVVQGGSTITQQLAKNLFLSQERTLKRKIQEAMLALWLEYELTKDEILAAYLNRVYLGGGTYGVDAASRLYFNKPVSEIDLRQAATLAGLLKAPSRYAPTANPGLSKERADVVLQAMADAGYIEESEADSLTRMPPRPSAKPSGADTSRYFADWIVDGLGDLIGTPDEDIIVETTLNRSIQEVAGQSLQRALHDHGEERSITQGAVVVMRPDGAVVAMVGGRDYAYSQFNRAVQAKRQPGSSFKSIVFLAALENGWLPEDTIMDEPFTTGRYRPKNFGNEYYGEVSLTNALTHSLNTATVRLAQAVGINAVVETARRLGIISPLEPDLSLALGSSSVSLLEMTTAYSVLANGGAAAYPYAITRITNKDGTLYYQRPDYQTHRLVVDPRAIAMLTPMMESVVQNGTGRRAMMPFKAAGKTGTSQDSRDAWFIGFSDELVGGVWMGNDDNSPMKNVTGGSFPAGIWADVMASARGQYRAVSTSPHHNVSFQSLIGRLINAGPYEPGDPPPSYLLQAEQPPARANTARRGTSGLQTSDQDSFDLND